MPRNGCPAPRALKLLEYCCWGLGLALVLTWLASTLLAEFGHRWALAAFEESRAGVAVAAMPASGDALLQPGGLELDLSAIAKGFGVDHVAAIVGAGEPQHPHLAIGRSHFQEHGVIGPLEGIGRQLLQIHVAHQSLQVFQGRLGSSSNGLKLVPSRCQGSGRPASSASVG